MQVAVFFTFDYSLKTWSNSGTIEREVEIYKKLKDEYGVEFIFFTYGDSTDNSYKEVHDHFEVIPIYSKIKYSNSKIIRLIKSFIIPFIYRDKFKDVSILHQHQLLGSWVPIIIKLIYKKPLVLRTGYNSEVFAKNDKKSSLLIMSYKILNYLALKICDLYTVASFSDYELLKKYFKKDKLNRLQIRPNWVEINESQESYNKRYKNKILTVGRLENQKNFELLIQEFKDTKDYISIDIVGSGSLLNELKKLAEKNNTQVNFIGNLKYEHLLNLYSKYMIYISTSFFEGNPKTVLEAMGSGCIVVASDIPNHRELIDHKVNGYLFDLEYPNLLNIYNEVILEKSSMENISNKSKQNIKENNNISKLSKNMYEDYQNILI